MPGWQFTAIASTLGTGFPRSSSLSGSVLGAVDLVFCFGTNINYLFMPVACRPVTLNELRSSTVNVAMKQPFPYRILLGTSLIWLTLAACYGTDTTKIIQPTDYQISTVSLSLPREVVATNMAAQPVEDHDAYTLVGATLRKGKQHLIGLWLFSEEDSSFVKSVNQEAIENSPFPQLQGYATTQEAQNLTTFLTR